MNMSYEEYRARLSKKIIEFEREIAESREKYEYYQNKRLLMQQASTSSASQVAKSARSTVPPSDRRLRSHGLGPAPIEPIAVTGAAVPPDSPKDVGSSAPKKSSNYGKLLQPSLATRLEHICTQGLSKENQEALISKYLIPPNCKRAKPPILNEEVKQTLKEAVIKRDMIMEEKQKVAASAISCLGNAITSLLCSRAEKDLSKLAQLLINSVRLMCDCQYHDSLIRREFLLSSIKKKMTKSLRKTKIDGYLFGSNKSNDNSGGSATNVMPSTSKGSRKRKSTLPNESSKGSSSKKGRKTSSKMKTQRASTSKAKKN